jgi:hypothetical protein
MSSTTQKQSNINCDQIGEKVKCEYCSKDYASSKSLNVHVRLHCTAKKNAELLATFDQKMANALSHQALELTQKMERMNDQMVNRVVDQVTTQMTGQLNLVNQDIQKINKIGPRVQNFIQNDNKNLNVMCIGSKDNLLEILSSREGLHLALTYIKDSALGRLAADCRILERAYLPPGIRPAIMYRNQSKNQLVYYDENNKRQIETNPAVLAKKLADILQRSYLKGMDTFKTDLCGEKRSGLRTQQSQSDIPEVDAYDINLMNEHIHELQNEKYQKSLLKSMKIPLQKELLDEYFE